MMSTVVVVMVIVLAVVVDIVEDVRVKEVLVEVILTPPSSSYYGLHTR